MDFEHDLITVEDDWQKNTGDAIAAQLREAGFKVKRTVLPGSTFWNDWTKYPYSMTIWYMRPLGVQVLALGYRTGEAWNESGYSNPDFDAKLAEALAISDPEKRREVMKDLETDPAGFRRHHPALLAVALFPHRREGEGLRHPPDLPDGPAEGLARRRVRPRRTPLWAAARLPRKGGDQQITWLGAIRRGEASAE